MNMAKVFNCVLILPAIVLCVVGIEITGISTATAQIDSPLVNADTEKLAALPLEDILAKIKNSTDMNERRRHIGALYRYKVKEDKNIARLADFADENNGQEGIREVVVRVIENVGPKDKKVVPGLIKLLNHQNGHMQYVAMKKCGELRVKEAWPIMIGMLPNINAKAESGDDVWRLRGIIIGLGNYGKDGLPQLLKLRNESKDADLRKIVESAMHAITDKECLPQFLEIFGARNNDVAIKGIAVEGVGQLDPELGLKKLEKIYKGERDLAFRSRLIDSLALSKSDVGVSVLEKILLEDTDPVLRSAAATGLDVSGGKNIEVILQKALEKEQDSSVRMSITFYLEKMVKEKAIY